MERLERTPSTRGFVAQLPYERDFTKTERRPVVRGAQSGDEVEILSGLEVGQVIITP